MAVTGYIPRIQIDLEGLDLQGGSRIVPAGSELSARIRLYAPSGALIDNADVSDVRYTLYNKTTKGFINSRSGVKGSQTYAIAGQPVANDTITIGGIAWTFKVAAAAAREVTIGASSDATGTNLAASISLYSPHVTASYDAGTDTLTVTARQYGANGNSITTVESATNITAGGATLSGGTDGVDTGSNTADHRIALLAADNVIVGAIAEGETEIHTLRVVAKVVTGITDADSANLDTVIGEQQFYVRKQRVAA